MKQIIRVGDRVAIKEGHYWPWSKHGTVKSKDPILSANGKRAIGHWYLVQLDGASDPLLFPRKNIKGRIII